MNDKGDLQTPRLSGNGATQNFKGPSNAEGAGSRHEPSEASIQGVSSDVTGCVEIHERSLKVTPESVTLALRVPGPLVSVSEEGQTRLTPTFLAGAVAHSRKHLGFGAEILVLRIGYVILDMQHNFPDQSYYEN